MIVSIEILESHFTAFSRFISKMDKMPFIGFKDSRFIDRNENYKFSVYYEAREKLAQKWWKKEDIGSGKIQKAVSLAIQTRVNHNYEIVDNNLIDWRKKDSFSKKEIDRDLEDLLYNFFKYKIGDQQAFERFSDKNLSYQFIAYLFFIKDKDRFMPISQTKFDEIFDLIGLPNFKTSHNLSWENYSTYLNIVKQTQNFLQSKNRKASLLDAHSFLWIIGNQMRRSDLKLSSTLGIEVKEEKEKNEVSVEEKILNNDDGVIEIKLTVDNNHPEEFESDTIEQLFEGAKQTITVNSYERNRKARECCIQYWKAVCAVCSFDFEKTYGEIGKGFIHVHHLTPVHQIGKSYQVDPVKDLIPVCPNCHSMLHRRQNPYTIDEIKALIKTVPNNNSNNV